MEMESPVSSSQLWTLGVSWVEGLSKMTCTSRPAGTCRLTLFKNATKSAEVCDLRMSVITVPAAMFSAANRSQVPLRPIFLG